MDVSDAGIGNMKSQGTNMIKNGIKASWKTAQSTRSRKKTLSTRQWIHSSNTY